MRKYRIPPFRVPRYGDSWKHRGIGFRAILIWPRALKIDQCVLYGVSRGLASSMSNWNLAAFIYRQIYYPYFMKNE